MSFPPIWQDNKYLPPELDIEFYRSRHADLASYSDAELQAHFLNHGIAEGRMGSPAAARAPFLELIPLDEPVLEIGPFCNPALRGPQVSYFDVLDREQSRARARALGLSEADCPYIDYCSPQGDLGIVDQKFLAAFSSHSIEHQPDFVRHLEGVADILESGGRYYMAVPDGRYCFDAFIPPSSIADILAAYAEARVVHSAGDVLEHRILLTHNDPVRHWNGDHLDPGGSDRIQHAHQALAELATSAGRYIDVHAWQFTPNSFQDNVNMLREMGLCKFSVERIYSTVRNSLEFYVVLKLGVT